jgi:hypothetical protein
MHRSTPHRIAESALVSLILGALVGCTATGADTPPAGEPSTAAGGSAASPGATTPGDGQTGAGAPAAGPIEQIGFRTTFSVFSGVSFSPVLVLRDGKACDCADQDLDAFDEASVAQKRPNDMGTWRKGADRIEVQWSGSTNWDGLSKVPAVGLGQAWRSANSYSRTTSIGTSGAGDWVGAEKGITFDPSGRFRFAGGVSTEVSGYTSKSGGTYDVNGYMLTLKFDDGTTQRVSAFTTPDDPGHVLWLGGAAYTQ